MWRKGGSAVFLCQVLKSLSEALPVERSGAMAVERSAMAERLRTHVLGMSPLLCDVQQWALWLCLLLAPAITFRSQGGEETPEEVRCTAGCMPLAAALSSWYRAWLSLFRSFYVTEISSTSSLLLDLFGLKRRKVLACCRQCHVKWQRLDKFKCLQPNRHAGSWSHWCHWTWLNIWISFLYPFPLSFFLFVKEMQCWSIAKETPCSKCRCFLCWASVPKANPWLGLLRMLSCLA